MNQAFDPYAHSDVAYVLGTLDPVERSEFEAHLAGCAACRARVAEARDTLALLGPAQSLPAEAFAVAETEAAGVPPDTLLPGLLRRARREQRRRRVLTGAIAAVAAACLVALIVAVWPGSSPPAAPQQQALQALTPVETVSATASLQSRAWGTEIDVRCKHEHEASNGSEAAGVPYRYELRVTDSSGKHHSAGSWAQSDKDVYFIGGTDVRRERITRLQVTLADGTPILQLDL